MIKIKESIRRITATITQNKDLYKIFYFETINRKYEVQELMKYVFNILRFGSPYRIYELRAEGAPCWTTIYKFYRKLIKHNIFQITFDVAASKYMSNKTFITDTTLIPNKYGTESVSYTPQLTKHKSTKISAITNIKGKPIDVHICKSSINDAKILDDQLDKFNNCFSKNDKTLLGDKAYDSEIIRNKLKLINFGKLLTPKNKRNTKDKNKLRKNKLDYKSKKHLRKRIKIEHFFSKLKQYRRIYARFDKKNINFLNFVYFACIDIIFK